jgi:hypothetical protein
MSAMMTAAAIAPLPPCGGGRVGGARVHAPYDMSAAKRFFPRSPRVRSPHRSFSALPRVKTPHPSPPPLGGREILREALA